MTLPRRAWLLILAVLFISLWAALALWAFSSGDTEGSSKNPQPPAKTVDGQDVASDAPTGNRPKRTLPFIEAKPAFDTSDPRKLIGFSENVFTAKVGRKVSEVPLKSTIPGSDGSPQVQFQVTVDQVIKSKGPEPLSSGDETIVDQMGGTDPDTGHTYRIETSLNGEDYTDAILEPGEKYLFATRWDSIRDFHTVTAQPHGDLRLSGTPDGEAKLQLYQRSAEDQVNPLEGAAKEGSK